MADLERELALDAGTEALIARVKTKSANGKTRHYFRPEDTREIVMAILVTSSDAIANHRAYLAEKEANDE